MVTPDTRIILLKSPLQLSNKHQITFANSSDQFQYFYNLPKLEEDDAQYLRKDGVIRFPAHADSLQEFNYCMYQNDNYSNKWFYAFITNIQYANDTCSFISIKTDVFQTWQFSLNYLQSFIEREMINVNEDVAGNNLVPENLETGEYKVGGTAEFDELEHYYCIAYTGDTLEDNIPVAQRGYSYNGIYSSVTFIFTNVEGFSTLINIINSAGKGDKILTAFTIPKLAVWDKIQEIEVDPNVHYYYYEVMDYNYKQSDIVKTLASTPNNLDGYVPRNQKLRTYPFMYVGFNPSNGTSKIYRYEDFANGTPVFKLFSEINQNPTVAFIPQNYRGAQGDSMSDISYLNGYPTISYKNDVFNTWLAQNSEIISIEREHEQNQFNLNQTSNTINGITNTLGNLFTGNVGGAFSSAGNAIMNGISNQENHEYYIKNQMAQIERQKMLPDNSTLSSTNATLLGYNKLDKNIFSRYTIKAQYAERIDKYFDMYGYLTNKIKVPNINNRPNWNYVKTVGINIMATIPQLDLAEIKQMFDNGLTLWHTTTHFLDYSQNNR